MKLVKTLFFWIGLVTCIISIFTAGYSRGKKVSIAEYEQELLRMGQKAADCDENLMGLIPN